MKIVYHPHAKRRMIQRNINDAEVRQVLTSGAKRYDGMADNGSDKWVTRGMDGSWKSFGGTWMPKR